MANNEYHMESLWRVRATAEEVFDIIMKAEDLPRWWPSAFVSALPIQSGDDTGAAKVTRLVTRGFLPYRLVWHVVAEEVVRPTRLVNRVWGDFEGAGTWTLTQDGEWTTIHYDWRISVHMPLVQVLSPVMKPLFVANHRWAMAKGEESLRLELDRVHAGNAAQRAAVPEPPGGIERSTWAAGLGASVVLWWLFLRKRG